MLMTRQKAALEGRTSGAGGPLQRRWRATPAALNGRSSGAGAPSQRRYSGAVAPLQRRWDKYTCISTCY